ncbi:hypothetical protein SLE2022_164710 [Rubroshorea leprosula]
MGHQILLILSLFSLILFNSANAFCVPRSDFEVMDQPPVKIDSSTVFAASSTSFPSPVFSVSSTVFPSPSSQAPRSQPTQRQASSPHASPKQSPAPAHSPVSHVLPPSGSIRSHLAPQILRSASSDPYIQKICEQTDYPSLCFSSLVPVFNGKTDPLSVAELLIKTVFQQTKLAVDTEALDAIMTEEIGTIRTMLSDVIDDYATCDDGFTGQPDPEAEGVSPMAAIGEDLMNMIDNILAIVNSIP